MPCFLAASLSRATVDVVEAVMNLLMRQALSVTAESHPETYAAFAIDATPTPEASTVPEVGKIAYGEELSLPIDTNTPTSPSQPAIRSVDERASLQDPASPGADDEVTPPLIDLPTHPPPVTHAAPHAGSEATTPSTARVPNGLRGCRTDRSARSQETYSALQAQPHRT